MKQLVFLGGLLLAVWCFIVGAVNIKLVDPPHNNRYYTSSSSTKVLTLRAPPANISGPPHLQLLSGECFKLKDKRYTYSVCPFHNVTQNEESSVWNSFHGVLGVWREWLIEEDVFVGMHYTLGEPCGRSDREAKIMFQCSTVTRLTNVTEPSTCKYTIWLHTPLACFKGAMQIYHVLTPAQISKWDDLNQEYHNGDLTKKGLNKRRRQLLLGAGLYYNFTKDQEYLKKQNSNPVSSVYSTTITTSNSAMKTELDHCNERVKSFEKQLNNAKSQMQVVLTMVGEKDPLLKDNIERYLVQLEKSKNNTNQTNIEGTTGNKTDLSENSQQSVGQHMAAEKLSENHPLEGQHMAAEKLSENLPLEGQRMAAEKLSENHPLEGQREVAAVKQEKESDKETENSWIQARTNRTLPGKTEN